MSTFSNHSSSTASPWLEMPRKVNLVIRDFPEGITREILKESLLSPYDNGIPSEFQSVVIAFSQMFDTVSKQAVDVKFAFVTATFRDEMDEDTLHYHLYSYVFGWALPIRITREGVTHHLFATLWDRPFMPFLKDVLWEHHEQQRKRESTAVEQALRVQLAQKDKEIDVLHNKEILNRDTISTLHLLVGKNFNDIFFANEELRKKEELLIKQRDQFMELQRKLTELQNFVLQPLSNH